MGKMCNLLVLKVEAIDEGVARQVVGIGRGTCHLLSSFVRDNALQGFPHT